jgi:hexosaminidase
LVRNAAFTPTYFVTGGPAKVGDVPAPVTYELWHPTVFVDGIRLTPEQNARNLGSSVYVWCDDPTARTPAQIVASITMSLRVMAQKTWGPTRSGSYPEFAALSDAVAEPAPRANTFDISTLCEALVKSTAEPIQRRDALRS